MAPKRKRGLAQTPTVAAIAAASEGPPSSTSVRTPRKRARVNTDSGSPGADQGPTYKVRSIVDESRTHYKIDWEDDPVTGEKFAPTWEPKANANAAAVKDWKLKSRPKKGPSPVRVRRKPRRVIDSSPFTTPTQAAAASPPARESTLASEEDDQPVVIEESQHSSLLDTETIFEYTTRASRSLDRDPVAAIQIDQPPSSYFAGAYERHSASPDPSSSYSSEDHAAETIQDLTESVSGTEPEPIAPANGTHPSWVYSNRESGLLDDITSSRQDTGDIRIALPLVQASSYPEDLAVHADQLQSSPVGSFKRQRPVAKGLPLTDLVGDSQAEVGPHFTAATQLDDYGPIARHEGPENFSNPATPRQRAAETVITREQEGVRAQTGQSAIDQPEPTIIPTADLTTANQLGSSISFEDKERINPVAEASKAHTKHLNAALNSTPAIEQPAAQQPYSCIDQTRSRQTAVDSVESAHHLEASVLSAQSSFPFLTQVLSRSNQRGSPKHKATGGPRPASQLSTTMDKHTDGAVKPKEASPKAKMNHDVSDQPASAIPPMLTVEIAATLPPRSSSPGLPDGPRSPSVVPAAAPEEPITREDMNTSERYPSLLPQTEIDQLHAPLRPQSSVAASATGTLRQDFSSARTQEAATSFVVPISFLGHQRDQYSQELYFHREKIAPYLATAAPSADLQILAEDFITRLRNTAIHPDLNNPETATQHPDEPERQARWDIDCSAKFRFLASLFEHLNGQSISIAIVARGAQICDMLETFLRGIQVPCVRTRGAETESTVTGTTGVSPRAWIVDQSPGSKYAVMDAVILLDGTTKPNDSLIASLRRRIDDAWAPLLSLVVPHTIEHIDRCLLDSISSGARIRALVSGSERFKHQAGRPEPGQVSPSEAAIEVAAYLAGTKEWCLSELSMLEDLDSQTDSQMSSGGIVEPHPDQEDTLFAPLKRPVDEVEAEAGTTSPAAKRVKAADQPVTSTINPQDAEITHVSDSLGKQTQTLDPEMSSVGGTSDTARMDQQFIDLIRTSEARIEELNRVMEELQYRHEDQRQELLTRTKERDSAIATAHNAIERMTRTEAQNTALRTERTELKAQLADATSRLADHSVPERQEYEAIRLAMEQVKLETRKAEKRAEGAERDLAYTRTLYQDSSSRAQELVQQNEALQAKVAVLEKVASGEQARARSGTMDTLMRKLQKENRQLKTMLIDREAGLRFRDEEIQRLKEAGRGRMGTRNSSVPRSPRLGSPYKSGRGSRQTSPTSGNSASNGGGAAMDRERSARGHPLRNSNANH